MYIAHQIELRPTATQAEYFRKCCGTSRFVYNKLVERFKSGEKYSRAAWQKFCVYLRQSTPWMRSVTARAVYETADNFHAAMQSFFKSVKTGKKPAAPRFKKKGKNERFQFSHSAQFKVYGGKLRIQGMKTWIDMREKVRFEGPIKSANISYYSGKWYVSFTVKLSESIYKLQTREPSVGVDFGLKNLATLSTGEIIGNPRPLERSLVKLKKTQKQLSNKVKGSNRWKKQVKRLARLHKKVRDQREHSQHVLTSNLVKRFDKIIIEDLDIKGMLRNRRLSRQISDAAWYSLRKKLEYKSKLAGVSLVVVDRYFASSKTCSECGNKVEKIPLSQREFNCPCCGLLLDRDLNAAINLVNYCSTSPPITGRSKTDTVDSVRPFSGQESVDGVNISSFFQERGISTVATG